MPVHKFEERVLSVREETHSVKLIRIQRPEDFKFQQGQYVSVDIPNIGKKILRKPYSICSFGGEDYIELCVKMAGGLGSEYMFSLKKGDKVTFLGPMGNFVLREGKDDITFLASGTGVGVFLGMIKNLLEKGFKNKIVLLKGARDEDERIYEIEFRKLSKRFKNFSFYNILSEPKKEFEDTGYVQDYIGRIIPVSQGVCYYLCGLKDMIDSSIKILKEKGVADDEIYFEKYD